MAKGLWIADVPADCAGYMSSAKQWFDNSVKEVFISEVELVDDVYGFIGHPDLVCLMVDDMVTLVDWKTPVQSRKTWRGQLAAYKHLAENDKEKNLPKIDKIGSLMLDPNGKYPRMNIYQYSEMDFAAFLAALSAFKYFSEKEY